MSACFQAGTPSLPVQGLARAQPGPESAQLTFSAAALVTPSLIDPPPRPSHSLPLTAAGGQAAGAAAGDLHPGDLHPALPGQDEPEPAGGRDVCVAAAVAEAYLWWPQPSDGRQSALAPSQCGSHPAGEVVGPCLIDCSTRLRRCRCTPWQLSSRPSCWPRRRLSGASSRLSSRCPTRTSERLGGRHCIRPLACLPT